MASRIDPGLRREIAKLGANNLGACMSCGFCTATCELSTESEPFPRRIVHLLQIGHRERLTASFEPWLCYYCGDCSVSCPRDANPAEIMMAARRYLAGAYDPTGIIARIWRFAVTGERLGSVPLSSSVGAAWTYMRHTSTQSRLRDCPDLGGSTTNTIRGSRTFAPPSKTSSPTCADGTANYARSCARNSTSSERRNMGVRGHRDI
jgi:ferredoxin